MIDANKYRLGIFVILGVVLFFATLFVLGLSSFFTQRGKFISLFKESVQGLAEGSPVKYKGVPIGRVSDISIRVSDKLIRVDMDININAFRFEQGNHAEELSKFYEFFKDECRRGLCSRLEYSGITGLKYVELDYFSPSQASEFPDRPDNLGDEYFYIPSVPSIFKDILRQIDMSLEKISRIKFEEISDEMTRTLKSAQEVLNNPKLKRAISQLESMSANLDRSTDRINRVLTEQKIQQIVDNLNQSLKDFDNLTKSAHKQLEGAKVEETSASFRGAAESVTQTRQSLNNTLLKLNQTLDAVTELANYLNDDPGALLRGKEKPPAIPKIK